MKQNNEQGGNGPVIPGPQEPGGGTNPPQY